MKIYEKIKLQMGIFGITVKDLQQELKKCGIKTTQKFLKEEYLTGNSDIPSEWLEVIRNYLPDYDLDRFVKLVGCIESKVPIDKFIEILPVINHKYFKAGIKHYLLEIQNTKIYQKHIIDYLECYFKNGKRWRTARRKMIGETGDLSVKEKLTESIERELNPGSTAAGLTCAVGLLGVGGYGRYKMKK